MRYNFGAAIKYYRLKYGITQGKLANKSGVSRSMIGMLESGHRKTLSADSSKDIAEAFGITCDQLAETALLLGNGNNKHLHIDL